MSISLLLEMAASSDSGRLALVSGDLRLTGGELSELADGGAGVIAATGAEHVVYVGTGGVYLPLLMFSSARAGVPFARRHRQDIAPRAGRGTAPRGSET